MIERRQRPLKAARTIDDPKTVCNVENEVPGAVTTSDLARVTRKLTTALDVYNSRRLSDDVVTSAKCKSWRSGERRTLLENLFPEVPRTTKMRCNEEVALIDEDPYVRRRRRQGGIVSVS